MIRAETATDWLLVTHPDHAHLAGQVADAWGNDTFASPEPFAPLRYAVYHHDDGWIARDAAPHLTPAGKPEAFTRDLVGAYSAFEEIDLPDYLQVRANATAEVAAEDLVAAVFVSMHTVNLLTEQADLSTIRPEHRTAHADFIANQEAFQRDIISQRGLDPVEMQRGFAFLQACDNLSLIVCSGFSEPRPLRHQHPDRTGARHTLQSTPLAPNIWQIAPWPFSTDTVTLSLPRRQVAKSACENETSFRDAFAAAPVESVAVTLQR